MGKAVGASDAEDGQRLDQQVCFALYAASRAVMELYRPALDQLGLTYPQYLVMLVLWQQDARPVGEIATQLQLDYGTVTPLLQRLETKQLLTRQRPAGNEATVLASLTPAGAQLRQPAAEIPAAMSTALQRTNRQNNQELIATLHQLAAQAHTAEPPTLSEPPVDSDTPQVH